MEDLGVKSEGRTGVVIGYGSVGRRHAKQLEGLASKLVIVDSNARAREAAAEDFPSAVITDRLEALDGSAFWWPSAVVVVATWGPSHANLFEAIAERGVRHVLCEKPLASSVQLADTMASRAEREGIAMAVNHYIRYSGLVPALRGFTSRQELGSPVGVVVDGGAACLLTNGIHWIDFASELFDAMPKSVVSTAHGEHINPRASDLLLVGGTAVWQFDEGREAVISFNNRSSLALKARVLYRNAIVEINSDLLLRVRCRDEETVRKLPTVTRTGHPSKLLFEGALPEVRDYGACLREAIRDVLENGGRICPARVGVTSLSACIGALVSSRIRRAVDLPIAPGSPEGAEKWSIS
jgi:predicted dehydrogenase